MDEGTEIIGVLWTHASK